LADKVRVYKREYGTYKRPVVAIQQPGVSVEYVFGMWDGTVSVEVLELLEQAQRKGIDFVIEGFEDREEEEEEEEEEE